MRCPRCGSQKISVIDSRSDGSAIRRRRLCRSCKFRFTSYERVELDMPMVVKKDGRREPFDRNKLRSGLIRACEKTSVGIDAIDRTLEEIEARIVELNVKELGSRQLGDFLMESLKKLDQIAYVRFASVYREFTDVSQFMETLRTLNKKIKTPAKKGK